MKVLLTCASSGIGQAVLNTKNQTENIEWIPASRSDQNHLKLDFGQPGDFDSLALQAGILDGLVLIPPRISPPTDLIPTPNDWNHYFNQAFVNPLQLVKSVIDSRASSSLFKIVIIGGLSSVCALPAYGSANALRLAWLGQVKSMALTLGNRGIRINTLSIGAVLTESYKEKLIAKAGQYQRTYEQQLALETDNVPTGHYSTPTDIAHAVHSLLGPMSDQMTGQNLLMDGGFFRGY